MLSHLSKSPLHFSFVFFPKCHDIGIAGVSHQVHDKYRYGFPYDYLQKNAFTFF